MIDSGNMDDTVQLAKILSLEFLIRIILYGYFHVCRGKVNGMYTVSYPLFTFIKSDILQDGFCVNDFTFMLNTDKVLFGG